MGIVALIGWPLHWTRDKVGTIWNRYVFLAGVRQENELLRAELAELQFRLSRLHEEVAEVDRLRALLAFEVPEDWELAGGRVVSHRFGPHAAVESFLVDKGVSSGVTMNTPVITPRGVVGRVLRESPGLSQVLAITDPNSKVAVMGRDHRTQGILVGQGPADLLQMHYVPLNDVLEEGEVLITSGMDGIFPKGLPVAVVYRIVRSSVSLFQTVEAVPMVSLRNLEEVLLVMNFSQPVVD